MPTKPDIDEARRRKLIKCVKAWRKKRNIAQRELARLMNKSYMWANRFEAGKVKRIDVVEFLQIADICRFNAGAALNQIRRGCDCC